MFILPKLNYSYDALEPYIDAKTMEIHHTKHHETYTQNFNKALLDNNLPENISIDEIFANMEKYPDAIRNNGGGYYNHSFFWESLTKQMMQPNETLGRAIEEQFGGLDGFNSAFTESALKLFGSGWTWLVLGKDKKLKIVNTSNQNNPLMSVESEENRGIPLLGIDLWEHAYYLNYQNRRKDYALAFMNIIDWQKVSERYDLAMK